MFELWIYNQVEIIDDCEGYAKISFYTADFLFTTYRSNKRDKFLDDSYWEKL